MIDLNKEAEDYADYSNDYVPLSFGNKFNENTKKTFIAGANSTYVQAKIIQAQIDVLKSIGTVHDESCMSQKVTDKIKKLQQQLKQLEDE